MSVLVDTNVLLRLRGSETARRSVFDNALEQLVNRGEALHLCTQVAIEFWSVATRPLDVNGFGLDPAAAKERLRYFATLLVWLPEPADVGQRWLALVNRCDVRGKQVHDARLVAFMEAHGLTHILTLNTADFTRYPTITALDPNNVR